jgi:hypothetical protein
MAGLSLSAGVINIIIASPRKCGICGAHDHIRSNRAFHPQEVAAAAEERASVLREAEAARAAERLAIELQAAEVVRLAEQRAAESARIAMEAEQRAAQITRCAELLAAATMRSSKADLQAAAAAYGLNINGKKRNMCAALRRAATRPV